MVTIYIKYIGDYCIRMYTFMSTEYAFKWLEEQTNVEYYKISK